MHQLLEAAPFPMALTAVVGLVAIPLVFREAVWALRCWWAARGLPKRGAR